MSGILDDNARRLERLRAEPTVRYGVPEGHDPAALMTALTVAGYDSAVEPGDTHSLVIACPPAAEHRERIREVIQERAPRTVGQPEENEKRGVDQAVRFTDE